MTIAWGGASGDHVAIAVNCKDRKMVKETEKWTRLVRFSGHKAEQGKCRESSKWHHVRNQTQELWLTS
jgi:hypothetical protein